MGSRDLGGHYDRLPGGEFDDIGANPAGLFARVDVLSSPSRLVTSVTRFPLFPVSSSRTSRWTLTPTSLSLPVAHRRVLLFPLHPHRLTRSRGRRRRRSRGAAQERLGVPRPRKRRATRGDVSEVQKPAADPAGRAHGGVRELRAGHLAGDQRAVRQRQRARACARARGGERRGADGEVSALRGAAPATPRGEPRDLRRVPSGDWDARRAGTAAKPRVRAAGTIAPKQPTAHYFMPRVLSAAAAAAGRAARGLRRMQAGDAGARGGGEMTVARALERERTRERTRGRGGGVSCASTGD